MVVVLEDVTVVPIATTTIVGVILRKNVTPKLASSLNKLMWPGRHSYFRYHAECHEFLKFREANQPVSYVAAQFSNPIAFVSRSSSLGPWILDSGA